jgi:HSP20 family protein
VLADLPGVRKGDLELSIQGNLLTIKGEKKREEPTQSHKVVRTETWVGSFSRTINLPIRSIQRKSRQNSAMAYSVSALRSVRKRNVELFKSQ